jgi:AAHS family 3-hydroxyphenylpropionic acid transporter
VLYLLLNWLPLLLIGKGFSRDDASLVQVLFQVGGSSGALVLGWAIDRADRRIVLGLSYLALAGALLMLASPQNHFPTALVSGFSVGLFACGTTFLLYGFIPAYYSAPIRGTGVGWALAVGRFGSILGPLLAGILLGAGKTAVQVLVSILPIVLAGALAAHALQLYRDRRVF